MPQQILPMPEHIAIIMDGNGRWAKKRGLPRTMGHKKGAQVFGDITRYCQKIGVPYLTVYAFSTENWKRPQEEVDAIMDLMREYLKDARRYEQENVRTFFIGDKSPLADDIKDMIQRVEEGSSQNTGLTVNVALNYGGRNEIMTAVQRIAKEVEDNKIKANQVNEQLFETYLYTSGQPDPDLIIRPSGEHRISNFLLWQCAYSEFVYMDVLWPDFTPKHLDEAILAYRNRDRRFGGI